MSAPQPVPPIEAASTQNVANRPLLIFKQMAKISADISPIAKSRSNAQQNYKFRGIDDIYNMIQPIFAKHEVFSVPTVLSQERVERTTKSGTTLLFSVLLIKYLFYATDGSWFATTVVGEGMDAGDKASNKAMSAAQKYAYLQILNIPTEDPKDSENESHEVLPKHKSAPEGQKFSPGELITEPQRKRMWAIAKSNGWDDDQIKNLLSEYGIESSKDILKSDYEEICNEFEKGA